MGTKYNYTVKFEFSTIKVKKSGGISGGNGKGEVNISTNDALVDIEKWKTNSEILDACKRGLSENSISAYSVKVTDIILNQ